MKKYGIIYADPPWLYDDARTHKSTGMARSAYECMSVEEICKLPVASLADDDCMLCLWATMPKLSEALRVISAWGFKYITCGWVWVKLNKSGYGVYSGLGHWVNGNAELCLLGRKGKPIRITKDVKQIVLEEPAPSGPEIVVHPVMGHSRKPQEVRDRIETLFFGPYVELFAREQAPGWDVWGNEVKSNVEL
jgi:N6-adenosine-specific RNA methylase IME4